MNDRTYRAGFYYLGMGKEPTYVPATYQASNDRLIIDTSTSSAKVEDFHLMNILEIQINPKAS